MTYFCILVKHSFHTVKWRRSVTTATQKRLNKDRTVGYFDPILARSRDKKKPFVIIANYFVYFFCFNGGKSRFEMDADLNFCALKIDEFFLVLYDK